MQFIGSGRGEIVSQLQTVNRLARLVDNGENFVLWGENVHKTLEAAQWLAWKFNRLEETGRLEDVPNANASSVDADPLEAELFRGLK
jgi:hypothetical protein